VGRGVLVRTVPGALQPDGVVLHVAVGSGGKAKRWKQKSYERKETGWVVSAQGFGTVGFSSRGKTDILGVDMHRPSAEKPPEPRGSVWFASSTLLAAGGLVLGGFVGGILQKLLFEQFDMTTILWTGKLVQGLIIGAVAGLAAVYTQRIVVRMDATLTWALVVAVSFSAGFGACLAWEDELHYLVGHDEWQGWMFIGAVVGLIQWPPLSRRWKFSWIWIVLVALLFPAGRVLGDVVVDWGNWESGSLFDQKWVDIASAALVRVGVMGIFWGLLTTAAQRWWPRRSASPPQRNY